MEDLRSQKITDGGDRLKVHPVIAVCNKIGTEHLAKMPWNIRHAIGQINAQAWRYLLDIGHFVRNNTMKAGKSFLGALAPKNVLRSAAT